MKLFNRDDIPIVRSSVDIFDDRAREIVDKQFLTVSDIPKLYFQLEKKGGNIEIDLNNLAGKSEPPIEYRQILAGAVMNYEVSKRQKFRIILDKETFFLYVGAAGFIELDKNYYGTIQRIVSPRKHEFVADSYVAVAKQIHDAYLVANSGRLIK